MSGNYLVQLATRIRGAVEADVAVPEDSEDLFLAYALLLRAKGSEVTAQDVHDAWVTWMVVRDPTHPSLVPFDELPPEVQSEDLPFLKAIQALVATP